MPGRSMTVSIASATIGTAMTATMKASTSAATGQRQRPSATRPARAPLPEIVTKLRRVPMILWSM